MAKFPITSKFNGTETFRDHVHKGIDFAVPNETRLYSIKDGVVSDILTVEDGTGFGNAIFIKWEDGKEAVFGHLSKLNPRISVGDKIEAGDLVGLSGNTGNVIGNNGGFHLHFGLKDINGNWINPEMYTSLIQNMGEYVSKFSDIVQKLDPAEMLHQAMESLTDSPINFINQLFDIHTISPTLHTIVLSII